MNLQVQESLINAKRFLLPFVVSMVLSLVAVTSLIYNLHRREHLAGTHLHHNDFAFAIGKNIDKSITNATESLQLLANTPMFQSLPALSRVDPAINGIPEDADTEKREVLENLRLSSSGFSVLFVLSPNGDHYISNPYSVQKNLKKFNLMDRPYIREVQSTLRPVVSDSFVGADGQVAIAIAVPVLDDHRQIVCYLGGVYHLSHLASLAKETLNHTRMSFFLVDSEGFTIAHSSAEALEPNMRGMYIGSSVLAPFLEKKIRPAKPVAIFSGIHIDPISEKKQLSTFFRLSSGWGLCIMDDWKRIEKEIMHSVYVLAFWVGLCLAIIAGIGAVFAYRYGKRCETAEAELWQVNAEMESIIEARTKELREKNREMERFTYTVSHDLRSPLITITGFLGLLDQDIENADKEQAREDMGRIRHAAEKMDELLADLLELSRVGRLAAKPERLNVIKVANDAKSMVQGRFQEANAELVIDSSKEFNVYADAARVLQVFQNLFENAVKYRSKDSELRVHVRFKKDGGFVQCFVSDNGLGIPAEYQKKIFGLFEQLSEDSEGTGIGLALVQRIIEDHGGNIHVESEGEGKGSTFIFTLPAV